MVSSAAATPTSSRPIRLIVGRTRCDSFCARNSMPEQARLSWTKCLSMRLWLIPWVTSGMPGWAAVVKTWLYFTPTCTSVVTGSPIRLRRCQPKELRPRGTAICPDRFRRPATASPGNRSP